MEGVTNVLTGYPALTATISIHGRSVSLGLSTHVCATDDRRRLDTGGRWSSISRVAIAFARLAASVYPSAAATIEPFMRMYHDRVNPSGASRFARAARPYTIERRWAKCSMVALPAGGAGAGSGGTVTDGH